MVFCSPQQPKPFTPHFSSQKRSALRRPMQRAAMRDAPHYVFCLNLAHDSPPRALALHSTLSAPSQSRPYSYQKCGRRDEGQAWHKNPYPLGQTCIRARFPIEAFCGHVFRAKVPGTEEHSRRAYRAIPWRFRAVVRPPTLFSATYRGRHRRDSPSTSRRADDACGRNGTCHAATGHRHSHHHPTLLLLSV